MRMWCPEAVWAVLEAQPCVRRSVNLRVCFVCVKSSAGSQQARARSLAAGEYSWKASCHSCYHG